MTKTENYSEGGGSEVIAVYRRQIGGVMKSSTKILRLQLSVSSSRDPRECLA